MTDADRIAGLERRCADLQAQNETCRNEVIDSVVAFLEADERCRKLTAVLEAIRDVHAHDCAENKMGNGNGPCDCPARQVEAALGKDQGDGQG